MSLGGLGSGILALLCLLPQLLVSVLSLVYLWHMGTCLLDPLGVFVKHDDNVMFYVGAFCLGSMLV